MSMAKRKKQGKSKSKSDSGLQSNVTFRKEITGLLLAALGGVSLLTFLGVTHGMIPDAWALFLRRIFGWGAWVVALVSLVGGGMLVFKNDLLETRWLWQFTLGLEGVLVCGLGLTHGLAKEPDPLLLAQKGGGMWDGPSAMSWK